jgi:hypothetical protein
MWRGHNHGPFDLEPSAMTQKLALVLFVIVIAIVLVQPHVTHASPRDGDLAWASKRRTPVLVLQPVGLSAEGLAAIYHAAAAWNETGYVRYLVAPMVEVAPEPKPETIQVLGKATMYPFTSISTERGNITGAAIYLLPPSISVTQRYDATHEAGHVLGLDHSHLSMLGTSIAASCPTQYDVDALAARYEKDRGTFTIPDGYTYQRGGVDCSDAT